MCTLYIISSGLYFLERKVEPCIYVTEHCVLSHCPQTLKTHQQQLPATTTAVLAALAAVLLGILQLQCTWWLTVAMTQSCVGSYKPLVFQTINNSIYNCDTGYFISQMQSKTKLSTKLYKH